MTAPVEERRGATPTAVARPSLVFFYDRSSGHSRRVEGFLAQVLQRRRNHDTFQIHRVDHVARADLVERFGIVHLPTLVVVEDRRIRLRLERPRGCTEIQRALGPWLR